ncbi:type II toxin-antitoxin system RelE/ParE family toxin [Flavobacterium hydrophilum]|uniref:Type II toxin-antitoxin system RelE/ParE family toxin n=1 Tax=Flavobacterium hydrophilum TaxID=2211445 RepID=A0A2V4BXF6_9FLAO|nr:type II toxin-antitoxin system RelE/ParE family toxin [Flavobacterium hydrophilum]PXY43689.1 type II toxin-antitoxin system RelE/ParE family toxin [Flavobacterium hydrophilum]
MKIKLTIEFNHDLNDIVDFIAKDKPSAARNFKNDLVKKLKNDLVNPFHFKKSIYFENEIYRDYVFKGYTTIIRIDKEEETIYVIGILKYKRVF